MYATRMRDLVVRCFFLQAEDGIRDLVRSRGLGDVYKRQLPGLVRADARGHLVLSEGDPCRIGPDIHRDDHEHLSLIHI